jgi:hypothetical protein
VFAAQLEPTAAEPKAVVTKSTPEPEATVTKSTPEPEAAVTKSTPEPEASVTKSTSEPEAAVTKSTSEPEAAVTKSTAVEREAAAEAAPAEATSAKADLVKGGPTSVVTPTSAVNGRLTPTYVVNGRRTQRRAGCGDRHGGQTNRYLAHHDAAPFVRRCTPQPLRINSVVPNELRRAALSPSWLSSLSATVVAACESNPTSRPATPHAAH